MHQGVASREVGHHRLEYLIALIECHLPAKVVAYLGAR